LNFFTGLLTTVCSPVPPYVSRSAPHLYVPFFGDVKVTTFWFFLLEFLIAVPALFWIFAENTPPPPPPCHCALSFPGLIYWLSTSLSLCGDDCCFQTSFTFLLHIPSSHTLVVLISSLALPRKGFYLFSMGSFFFPYFCCYSGSGAIGNLSPLATYVLRSHSGFYSQALPNFLRPLFFRWLFFVIWGLFHAVLTFIPLGKSSPTYGMRLAARHCLLPCCLGPFKILAAVFCRAGLPSNPRDWVFFSLAFSGLHFEWRNCKGCEAFHPWFNLQLHFEAGDLVFFRHAFFPLCSSWKEFFVAGRSLPSLLKRVTAGRSSDNSRLKLND